MDRLAPEDIQAIVAGMANNRELITGIVDQLKEAIQLPPPSPPTSSSQPTITGDQQLNQTANVNQPPPPAAHGSQSSSHQTDRALPQEEVPPDQLPRSSHQDPPLPTQGSLANIMFPPSPGPNFTGYPLVLYSRVPFPLSKSESDSLPSPQFFPV